MGHFSMEIDAPSGSDLSGNQHARSFTTITDARTRIDDFLANIYNSERLHSVLGDRSPLEFETAFVQNKLK